MNKTVLFGIVGVGIVVLSGLGLIVVSKSKQVGRPVVEAAMTNVENVSPTGMEDANMNVGEDMASMSAEEMVVSDGKVTSVTVEGNNFAFLPKEIKVKKGETVKVLFKNTQGFHDFVIDEFKVATNQIKEGEEEEIEFVADKVGTFEYYCSVGKHRQMGMVGKLIVE